MKDCLVGSGEVGGRQPVPLLRNRQTLPALNLAAAQPLAARDPGWAGSPAHRPA